MRLLCGLCDNSCDFIDEYQEFDMGAFVLGVLCGWLAEWLFYNFWVKENEQGDCSSLQQELDAKNREISTLKSKLSEATKESSENSTTKAEAITTSATVSNAKKEQAPKKASTTKATSTTKKAATKTASKKTVASKKSTAKKASSPKTTPKKTATKTTAKSTTTKKTAKTKTSTKGDDFTKLSGIGPSMASTLKTLGIDSFTKLAATDDDILRDMLEASGARMNNNKEAMDSWNEQATLAAKGDFDGLKKLQETLKK